MEDFNMLERKGIVTFLGDPLTLVGSPVEVGDNAPDFSVVNNDLEPKTLGDFPGKVLIISAVPSLDTPVCDMETRRFNTEAGNLSDDIEILTISMDLPFAQKRWCGAAGVEKLITLSDHKEASFANNWGVLIKELRLLARAVWVVDRNGKVVHAQIVPEIAEEPDYDAALNAARDVV